MSANILFDNENKTIHLTNGNISYIMQVMRDGYLIHHYFGPKLSSLNVKFAYKSTERDGCPVPFAYGDERSFILDNLCQELPTFGVGDYRTPAFKAIFANGTTACDFRYDSHTIYKGKRNLENMPCLKVFDENDAISIDICMKEVFYKVQIILTYTIFANLDVIVRSVKVINNESEAITLESVQSLCLDLQDHDYEKIHLYGTHANERQIERVKLSRQIETIASSRAASSHQHAPFVALVRKDTTETHGEVIAASLVWSGNFAATTEVSHFGPTRVTLGINPFDFRYYLESKESFVAPEAVLVYSQYGLNDMSHTFHKVVNEYIIDKRWQQKPRPVLFNSWEAAYFDFTEDSIVEYAKCAKKAGAELLVLDDGWFANRNDDFSSLGDWVVNPKKLPNGVEGLCKRINELGLEFGIWFDPEMISPRSELYKVHKDWALHVPGHDPCLSRSELMLNFSKKEVVDYVFEAMSKILSSCNITFVKTDMTRSPAELYDDSLPAWRQGEVAYRYQMGVYDLFSRLNKAFPKVIFEGCAGGGRRFDLGMLCYQPQYWTSDNTDAIARLKIQYGTSLLFPSVTMETHVSAAPNHQAGRYTPLITRFICACLGNIGYEIKVSELTDSELEVLKGQVSFYKKYRQDLQFGTLSRLISPFESNFAAFQIQSTDKKRVFVMYFRVLSEVNADSQRVKLKYLDKGDNYKVVEHFVPEDNNMTMGKAFFTVDNHKNEVFSADELMHFGLLADRVDSDFNAYMWVLEKE